MPVLQERIAISVDTIMLATDFTQASEKAAAYAMALAQRFGSTVEIAHVFDPSKVLNYEEAILTLPLEVRRQNSNDYLERIQNDFLGAGVKARTVSPEGHMVAPALLKLAKQDSIDLIVAGTQARHGLERLILGSSAEELLRSAVCPVFTVGPEARVPPGGPIAFQNIVFATNFSSESAKAAAFALSFAEDSGAHLYFCHVLSSSYGSQQEEYSADTKFRAALAKMIPEQSYDWCAPECVLEHGDAAKGIVALAKRVDADLIVLGAHKASFFLDHIGYGVTPSVLAMAPCPVLTVC